MLKFIYYIVEVALLYASARYAVISSFLFLSSRVLLVLVDPRATYTYPK